MMPPHPNKGLASIRTAGTSPPLKLPVCLIIPISVLGGRGGAGSCGDGAMPTCSDGTAPEHVQGDDSRKVACPDGTRPSTCSDGSAPSRSNISGGGGGGSRGGGGRGGCAKAERLCCDGFAPVHDGDRSTKPCSRGRPVCDITSQC